MADKAIKMTSGSDVLSCWPVGSIYLSVTSTSPTTLFGGTWVQLKDRFLLGAGSTYTNGNTGGQASVTLTAKQSGCYNHSHTYSDSTAKTTTSANGSHQHTLPLGWDPNNLYLAQTDGPGDAATGWHVYTGLHHLQNHNTKWRNDLYRTDTPTSVVNSHTHTITL